MPDHTICHSLLDAVERYFDLMFDSEVSRFDEVFASSAQLHRLTRPKSARAVRARIQECARLRPVAEVQERSSPTGNIAGGFCVPPPRPW